MTEAAYQAVNIRLTVIKLGRVNTCRLISTLPLRPPHPTPFLRSAHDSHATQADPKRDTAGRFAIL